MPKCHSAHSSASIIVIQFRRLKLAQRRKMDADELIACKCRKTKSALFANIYNSTTHRSGVTKNQTSLIELNGISPQMVIRHASQKTVRPSAPALFDRLAEVRNIHIHVKHIIGALTKHCDKRATDAGIEKNVCALVYFVIYEENINTPFRGM